MKAGVLGVVDGSFRAVDSFAETVTKDGHDLDRRLEIDRVFSLPSGEMSFTGRAAAETLTNEPRAEIGDGGIRISEQTRIETKYTEFAGVTGEFVAVDSGAGTFAFDLISAETGTSIERATLDLDGFFTANGSATPWKAGFFGSGDQATNGVFHGEDLRSSHDLDAVLSDARLNQIGLTYDYDGTPLKMTAARSGYVEVYRPSEFDSERYLEFLREEILTYVR